MSSAGAEWARAAIAACAVGVCALWTADCADAGRKGRKSNASFSNFDEGRAFSSRGGDTGAKSSLAAVAPPAAPAASADSKRAANTDSRDNDKAGSKSAKVASDKKADGQAAKASPAEEVEPPRTLVEAFTRLGQVAAVLPAAPSKVSVPSRAWGQTTITPSITATKTASVAEAPGKAKGLAAGVSAMAGLPSASLATQSSPGREVLASRLSAQDVSTAASLGFTVISSTPAAGSSGLSIVRLVPPAGMSVTDGQRALAQAIPIGEFGRNLIYRPYRGSMGGADDATDGDGGGCPGGRCYAGKLIQWRAALGHCAGNVTVGVIDTGYDPAHPAFEGRRIALGRVGRADAPAATNWHGTGVLALLAGSPDSTTPGLIPEARFVVADVFFGDGRGQPISDSYSLLNALGLMERFGVTVVNLSLSGPRDALVEREIARLAKDGMMFIAAAGNEGPGAGPSYPAAYKGVIAVTAVNRDAIGYRHANQGSYIDLAAPGVAIWTAQPGRKEGYLTGTSFAAPFVTAVVAALRESVPGASKERLLERLQYRDLGTPGRDDVFGRGLLQAPAQCSPPSRAPESVEMVSVPGDTSGMRTSVMRVSGPAAGQR